MGEVISLEEYRKKKEKQKEIQDLEEIEELRAILNELISENNVSFCEDPIIMWYNINDGDDSGEGSGCYLVIDPYYLDLYGLEPHKPLE